MPISTPSQIAVPFATSGLKNAIPSTSNPVTGNAGYDAGFPATNMTPKEAGGIPPFGQDFNGILFDITTAIRYLEAGMQFPYSSSFATAVGGYPLGAIVTRTDGTGFWRNSVANNTTDPETFGVGWQPEDSGSTSVAMASSNVTLTALQAAKNIIIITGTLTANLQLIFPAYVKQWLVINRATGAFQVSCTTVSGTGFSVATGTTSIIYCDGTNVGASAVTGFDFLNTARISVASSATVNLNVAAPNTRNLSITGTAAISAFTVNTGGLYFVSFAGACTLVNSASLVTNSTANIITSAGDSCIIRATASNVVEILCYTRGIPQALGDGQTLQDVTSSSTLNTNKVNNTGRPIYITVRCVTTAPSIALNRMGILVNGGNSYYGAGSAGAGAGYSLCVAGIIPAGATYNVQINNATLVDYMELRT